MHSSKTYLLFVLVAIFFLGSPLAFAQSNEAEEEAKNQEDMAALEASKSAYLTQKMNLNLEQSQKFWPVYNEFNTKRKAIKSKMRALMGSFNIQSSSEEEAKQQIRKMHQFREEELALEKEYTDKFLKVINPKQLVVFYQSNREFNRKLLSHGMKHRKGHRRGGNHPPSNEGND